MQRGPAPVPDQEGEQQLVAQIEQGAGVLLGRRLQRGAALEGPHDHPHQQHHQGGQGASACALAVLHQGDQQHGVEDHRGGDPEIVHPDGEEQQKAVARAVSSRRSHRATRQRGALISCMNIHSLRVFIKVYHRMGWKGTVFSP